MKIEQPFLDLIHTTPDFLRDVLDLSVRARERPEDYATVMERKVLYGLYKKTSTRTHLSFGAAVAALGGSYVWQSWEDSNFSISDIPSEGRYVSTTAHVVLARLVHYEDVRSLASALSVPFINGCCDKFHPCQALADVLTIRDRLGRIEGARVLYFGVLNNVANSLALVAPRLGADLALLTPIKQPRAYDEKLLDLVRSQGRLELIEEPTVERLRAEIRRADVIYTDTWVDMEAMVDPAMREETERRVRIMKPFQLNQDNYGDSNALIMHCMPIHDGYEIDAAMLDHPNSVIFQQAENRMHAQRGVLVKLLGEAQDGDA